MLKTINRNKKGKVMFALEQALKAQRGVVI
jgi:hypothetical protein